MCVQQGMDVEGMCVCNIRWMDRFPALSLNRGSCYLSFGLGWPGVFKMSGQKLLLPHFSSHTASSSPPCCARLPPTWVLDSRGQAGPPHQYPLLPRSRRMLDRVADDTRHCSL